jgi:hypothetical protein
MPFQKKPLWLVKLIHFEYWTWWLFYLPLLPWFLWQALRAKSLTYFTNVDPCIDYGGFFGESKFGILEKINPNYLPKTIYIPNNISIDDLKERLEKNNISYPIICKPNIGERGTNVEKVLNENSLIKYHRYGQNYIIQEFIAYEIELGVLYHKMPNAQAGKITSITKKSFLTVTGNGNDSILNLMEQSDRARFQIETMKARLGNGINHVLTAGENRLLEPIGNHCRGTTFLDYNHLITNNLDKVFDQICLPIEGFHYGRFDLRVKSIDDLNEGKNIKIMELNGVSADPGHIYDPNYKLLTAYSDVARHWKILADISIAQQKLGVQPIPLKILWPVVKEHFFNN